MTIDFGALWQSANADAVGGDDNQPPEPGRYEVALIDAGAWFARSSGKPTMKLGWRRIEDGYEWSDIYGFGSEGAANFAKRTARDVGANVDEIADLEELDRALKEHVGAFYTVDVQQNGDYRNTYIAGTLTGDVPMDAPEPAPAAVAGSDDVPF
jgi:hypothetical protein